MGGFRLKSQLKRLFLLCTLSLTFSPIVYAEKSFQEQVHGEDGQVVYHFQYDYDEICKLLGINRHVFDRNWNNGFSIAEMADKLWIERRVIEEYFATFHYQEMQKWREKGTLSEDQYFTLVYRLKEDIVTFIERNPNKEL